MACFFFFPFLLFLGGWLFWNLIALAEGPDAIHKLHGFSPWPGEDIAELRRRHDAYIEVKKQLDEDVGVRSEFR